MVAIVLTMVACLLALFSRRPLTTYTIVLLPIAVQEMVLAIWLIAKGFGPPAVRHEARHENRGDDEGEMP